MQILWPGRKHFLVQGRIVFGALPPARREDDLSQACFARALFLLEGSAYDLIISTGPTSSYHHLRGTDFSIWMTLRALCILSTGTEESTPAPFRGGLRACVVQGWNEDPLLFEVLFYMSLIFVCLIYVENIFSHLSLTITSLVSFFLYGNCALLCFSNKNLNFFFSLFIKIEVTQSNRST